MLIGDEGTSITLAEAFFQPQLIVQQGIDGILEGLTLQKMEEVDNLIVDAVRNFLDDGPGFDLAAINIQRGRDHGLSDFNTIRESIGLDPIDDLVGIESLWILADMVAGTPAARPVAAHILRRNLAYAKVTRFPKSKGGCMTLPFHS